MASSSELIHRMFDTFSIVQYFKQEKTYLKLEEACFDKLHEAGYTIPFKDERTRKYKWPSWGSGGFEYFDFLGYTEDSLVLGECKLFSTNTVPIKTVEYFIDRIKKVKPGRRKIIAIFVSNTKLCKKGYTIFKNLKREGIEAIIYIRNWQ